MKMSLKNKIEIGAILLGLLGAEECIRAQIKQLDLAVQIRGERDWKRKEELVSSHQSNKRYADNMVVVGGIGTILFGLAAGDYISRKQRNLYTEMGRQ